MQRPARVMLLGCILECSTAVFGSQSPASAPLPSSLASAELQISHRPALLQPGDVALLTVTSRTPLAKVEARVFGRLFPFFEEAVGVWRGLVGVDLGVAPGRHKATLVAFSRAGKEFTAGYNLNVKPKHFQVRRLTVDEKFVNPSPEELERIGRESKLVESAFAATSAERLWSGAFLRPVPGEATSSFGRRSILNGQQRAPHAGTDFKASEGTAIRAPNAGKVVLSADLYFTGNTVILDHGLGLVSYFAHLSTVSVKQGDRVSAGDLIGQVGHTGRVTGPHLHWSLRLAGARVDPVSLIVLLDGVMSRE